MTYNKEFEIEHDFIDIKKIHTINIKTLNKKSIILEMSERLNKLEGK